MILIMVLLVWSYVPQYSSMILYQIKARIMEIQKKPLANQLLIILILQVIWGGSVLSWGYPHFHHPFIDGIFHHPFIDGISSSWMAYTWKIPSINGWWKWGYPHDKTETSMTWTHLRPRPGVFGLSFNTDELGNSPILTCEILRPRVFSVSCSI